MSTPRPVLTLLRRITALLGVGLTLALGAASISPGLHAWMHDHAAAGAAEPDHAPLDSPDHACAVTLFAGGLVALVFFGLLSLTLPLRRERHQGARAGLAASRPAYWHVPSHAPPVA